MVSQADGDSDKNPVRDESVPDKPVPHDLPDQQADADSEVPDPLSATLEPGEDGDVPETDEAGTGRKGQQEHTSGSEHPEPQEPSG